MQIIPNIRVLIIFASKQSDIVYFDYAGSWNNKVLQTLLKEYTIKESLVWRYQYVDVGCVSPSIELDSSCLAENNICVV